MADWQIGDNLYANAQGKYYRLNNGQQTYEESPYDAMTAKLNTLYDNQKNSQLAQLKAQRERAISGYNKQKTDLKPVFQNQRNQQDVINAQNVTRLRELMASQGINASGENLTTQASMASARQSALGEITGQENQAMGEIDRQIANENDPSREQAIINAIETERSSRLADAYQQSQQEIYQRYMDWRNYQLQLKQLEESKRASRATKGTTTNSPAGSDEALLQAALDELDYDVYKKMNAASPKLDPEATTGIASQPGSYWYARGYGSQYEPTNYKKKLNMGRLDIP
jgi:hypothetical protein